MKNLLKALTVFGVLYALSLSLTAQDHLYLRNADKLEVKILNTDSAWIEYREFEDERRRTRKIDKKHVIAIKYENGLLTDAFGQPLTLANLQTQRYTALSIKYKHRGIPLTCIGATLLAGGSTLLGVSAYKANHEPVDTAKRHSIYVFTSAIATLMIAAGVPLSVVGSVYLGKYAKYRRKAANNAGNLSWQPVLMPGGDTKNLYAGGSLRLNF